MPTRRFVLAGVSASAAASTAFAQSADPAARLWNEGLYLPYWAIVQGGRPPNGMPINQYAALIGEEAIALKGAANSRETPPDLAGAEAQNAVEAIVEASRGRRVVMLNEAHVASRHRLFLMQLLRALHREGFTHFAAEAFPNFPEAAPRLSDFKPGMAADPIRFMGYLSDPVFAEAVRESVALGYVLGAYEQRQDQRGSETGAAAMVRRDKSQASNFAKLLEAAPDARFLVYVGYSHLRETPDRRGNAWFAKQLTALTGIAPLTITQAMTGSFGPHAADSPATTAVLERFRPKAPILVRLPDGAAFGAADWGADLAVFHPNLPDVAGRPGWLAADAARRRATIRLKPPRNDGPLLAQAIHAADPDLTIPADHYLLQPGAEEATFFLRPGAYRIRLETTEGWRRVGEITV